MPYSLFLNKNSSDLITTIQALTFTFALSVLMPFLRIIGEVIVVIVIFAALVWTDVRVLSLLVILFGTIFFVYDSLFRAKLKLDGKQRTESFIATHKGVCEGIEGFKEIRIFGKERFFFEKVKGFTEKFGSVAVKSQIISGSIRYLIEFALVGFLVLIVFWFVWLEAELKTIVPILVVFGVAALRLTSSVTILLTGFASLRLSRFDISKLYSDLNEIQNIDFESLKKIESEKIQCNSNFELVSLLKVCFRYPDSKLAALENLSFEVRSGDSIGIIGASGSGKTTVVDVILGLLTPQSGELLYNNSPLINEIKEWQSHVAYLPQEIFLVDNNLRANICLGVIEEKIDENQLMAAIKQARLSDLVENLPDGLHTRLGERFVRLSGGQRQRVALA
jgi:ATP-binding cassette, subfamily B, bacterial PglK